MGWARIIIAAVRSGGLCPCPRCTVPKSDFGNTGTSEDRNRRGDSRRDPRVQKELAQQTHELVHNAKRAISNKNIEKLLKPNSWTPVIVSGDRRAGTHQQY
jgi:uncharacterized protein YcbX